MTIEKVVCRKLYRKWRKVGTSFANERTSDSERYIKENENVCGKNQGGSDICKPFFWEYFFPFLSRMNCDIALKKCLITLSSTLFQIWFKFLHINQFFMNQSLGQIMPPPPPDFQTYLRPRKASLEIHAAATIPLSTLLRKEHMVYLRVLKQM